jgi:MFS family permease
MDLKLIYVLRKNLMGKPKNSIFFLIILFLDITATNILIPVITQKFAIEEFDLPIKNFLLNANFSMLLASSYIFFAPVIGFLSDIIGRKKIIHFCLILANLGYFLILISHFTGWIFLLLFGLVMSGIGGALLPVSLASLADITFGRKRAKVYALVGSIILLSMQTIWLSSYLLEKTSYASLILISMSLELGALFIALKWLTETYNVNECFGDFSFLKLIKSSFKLISNREFLILLGLFFIFEFSWGTAEKYFASHIDFNGVWTYIFTTYNHVIMISGALILLPLLLRFFKILQLMLGALVISGTVLIIFAIFAKSFISWFMIVPLALSFGLLTPLFWLIFSNLATSKNRGLIMGIICPLWCLSWGISGVEIIPNLAFNKIAIELPLLISGILLLMSTLFINKKNKVLDYVDNEIPKLNSP